MRLAVNPPITALLWKTVVLIAICSVDGKIAAADGKYITQPSRATKQTEVAEQKDSGTLPTLTVNDSAADATSQSKAGAIESRDPSITTWNSTGREFDTYRSASQINNSTSRSSQPDSTGPQSGQNAGLNWVKRHPRGASNSNLLHLEPAPTNDDRRALGQAIATVNAVPSTGQPSHDLIILKPDSGQQSNTVSAQLTASPANQNLKDEPRVRLASKVSQQIIGDLDQLEREPVQPVSQTLGWASIGRQLSMHIRQSEHLASRGVFLSAREECQMALLVLVRYLDHLSNKFVSEPSLHVAQTALREAADFTEFLQTTEVSLLKQIVNSHETPILKQSELSQVSPLTLAEHYRKFAERKIIDASQNHPWFSDILYQMGRTYQAEADVTSGQRADHLRGLALVYYRAALAIVPTNSLASNQIGYVLLQQDRPLEAQQFLVASVDAKLDTPALQNLVEASRRLRDAPMEKWAMNTLSAIKGSSSAPEPIPISLVDNATFASLSPPSAGPKTVPQPNRPSISPMATHSALGAPSVIR